MGSAGQDGVDGPAGPPGPAGSNGHNALATLTPEPAGTHCENGGSRLEVGIDDGANNAVAGDGVLEAGEITATEYVCNGADATSTGVAKAMGNGCAAASSPAAWIALGAWLVARARRRKQPM